MLEIIAGASLGTLVAVAAAGVAHQRAKRVETRLVRPERFQRELHKLILEDSDAVLRCTYCGHEILAKDAKIIFRTATNEKGVVCDETDCLLSYMRTTAQTEPTHSEASGHASAA